MEKLNSLNVFKSINIRYAVFVSMATDTTCLRLDAGRMDEEEGGGDSDKGVIVTFQVREKKRLKSSLGANVGTQSGDMVRALGYVML